MKIKITILFFLTLFVTVASAQLVTQSAGGGNGVISEFQGWVKGKNGSIIAVKDTLNNPATNRVGALTIRPQDTVGHGIVPIYMSNGIYWSRISSSVIVQDGDSTTIHGNQICTWHLGVPTCFFLETSSGGDADSLHLNFDSTWILHYRNGLARPDSIFLLHTYLYVNPSHFSLTRNYLGPYGELLNATFLVDSIYRSPFGGNYYYIRYATGHIDSLPAGGGLLTGTQWSVRDSLNTPATLPPDGSIFLVGTAPTGLFTGHANQIATYDSVANTYSFQIAVTGDLLYNAATGFVSQLISGRWVRLGRQLLHQLGDSAYLNVTVGSRDSANLSFLVNNVIRGYFDRGDKDLYLNSGTALHLYNFDASTVSEKIYFGPGGDYIDDGFESAMRFYSYVGRFRLEGGLGTSAYFDGYSAWLPGLTQIGGIRGNPNPNTFLDLQDTSRGILIPHLTTAQRLRNSSDITTGSLTAGGTGYTNGSYPSTPLTGGTGILAAANLTVTGGAVTGFVITNYGRGYGAGQVLSATLPGGAGFQYTVTSTGTAGEQVYDINLGCVYMYDGVIWKSLCDGGAATLQQVLNSGNILNRDDSIISAGHDFTIKNTPNGTQSFRVDGYWNNTISTTVDSTFGHHDFNSFTVNPQFGGFLMQGDSALLTFGLYTDNTSGHKRIEQTILPKRTGGFGSSFIIYDTTMYFQALVKTGALTYSQKDLNLKFIDAPVSSSTPTSVYVLDPATGVLATYPYGAIGGGAAGGYANPYLKDSSFSSDREWELNGHTLSITATGFPLFSIDPGTFVSTFGGETTFNDVITYASPGSGVITDSILTLGPGGAVNRIATSSFFTAADFNSSSGLISIDYTNGQAATNSVPGFLTAADHTLFNAKQATISVTSPITLTGASVGMVNQGTTTTVLHGNAAGNPSFGAIVNADITNSTIDLTAKVTGTLPIANGGTGSATTSQNFSFIGPTSGSGAPSFRALVAGDIPSLSGTYLPLTGGTMSGAIAVNANNTLDLGASGTAFRSGFFGTSLMVPAINGGSAANDDITIQGTTHATRTTSYVNLQPNGGNVGIGTTAPAYALDVSSSLLQFGADNGAVTRNSNTLKTVKMFMPSYAVPANPLLYFFAGSDAAVTYVLFGGGSSSGYAATKLGFFTASDVTTTNGTERLTIISNGNVGIGQTTPTAVLHLKAGTATASTAPLKFTSGTNLTVIENGAFEYDGNKAYLSSGGTRQDLQQGKSGSFSQVGAATTVFTVTFGGTQPNATYKVNVTPTALLSAAAFYVTNKTTTTFDVTYLAGLTGTVTFDYALFQ